VVDLVGLDQVADDRDQRVQRPIQYKSTGSRGSGLRDSGSGRAPQDRISRRFVRHVFQGGYEAILVQKEFYVIELVRYIMLNPVRAGLVRRAEDWPWSSYRATTGEAV
jgi:hypothetical protein